MKGDFNNHVLLCGGIHMFGTQAALQTAMSLSFNDFIGRQMCDEFVQIVEVQVKDNGIEIDEESVKWIDLPFRKL